jgi:transcriptional regulator with XRE-family HTH domain
MSGLQRINDAIKFLKKNDFIEKQQDLVDKLGYNKTYISGILNGKTELSSKFIETFCTCFLIINRDWLLTGEGEMLRNGNSENAENSESINTEKSEYISYRELYEQAKEEIYQLHETVGRLKAENEIHKQSDNPDKD